MQSFHCSWQRLTVVTFTTLGCLYAADFLKDPSLANIQQWADQTSQVFSSPNASFWQHQSIPTIHSSTSAASFSQLPSTAEDQEKMEEVGFIPTLGLEVEHSRVEEEFQTGITSNGLVSERNKKGRKTGHLSFEDTVKGGREEDEGTKSKHEHSLVGEGSQTGNVGSEGRRRKWEGHKKKGKKAKDKTAKEKEGHGGAAAAVVSMQEGGETKKNAGIDIATAPSLTKMSSFEFRNASWAPEIGAWMSQCASVPPFRITETFARNPCANNCRGRGVCNLELAECRCFHGYTGAACELEKDFECNKKSVMENESQDPRPFGPWLVSICSATCDKRKGFCYCGKGTKYPHRQVAEQCGFRKIPGTDWQFDWTTMDPDIFSNTTTGYGWCNTDPADFYAKIVHKKEDCYCPYEGTWGYLCELNTLNSCYNQCSGNGVCQGGFCACGEGWHGIDCSVPSLVSSVTTWPTWLSGGVLHISDGDSSKAGQQKSTKMSIERHVQRPLIYVYDLPPEFNSLLMEGRHFKYHCVARVYDAENSTSWTNQLYGAENALLESLLASKHRTTNAEEADFFYVPVLGACATERAAEAPHMDTAKQFLGLRTYFSGEFYRQAYEHIKNKYPYWDRSEGRDHIWLFPWDEGACASPKEIWNSMMLVHWGNTNSKYNYSTTQYPADNWDSIPAHWRGSHPCYDPEKDLVLPSWKFPDPHALRMRMWTRQRENRPILFYFRGNLGDKYKGGRPEANYSMGIRQRLGEEFGTEPNLDGNVGRQFAPDVKVFNTKNGNYSHELASSQFCGVFPGDGWSGRMEDSILHGCIPVIIQDGVHLPYENVLDYNKFAVRIAEDDLDQMVTILRSIPVRKIDAMQSSIQSLWQRFTYHNSIQLEADRQELLGKSQRGDRFQPANWAIEYKKLTGDDAFATFIQVLHYKLSQQPWRITSKTSRNVSNVECQNYSYQHHHE